jgi:hypothetical protein
VSSRNLKTEEAKTHKWVVKANRIIIIIIIIIMNTLLEDIFTFMTVLAEFLKLEMFQIKVL